MKNYFNIQPVTLTVSPFGETATANAVRWIISGVPRGTTSAECVCTFVYISEDTSIDLYNWNLYIPENVLNQWLDDSVIDDYIISTSNGIIIKDTTSNNRPIL